MSEPPPPPELPALTEKQRRVLEAAMDVFAERGFAGASTSEIAKRAGVAEGTIFKQYKTKKDLLLGVVAPFVFRFVIPGQIDEVVRIMRGHDDLLGFLRAFYRDRLQFALSHRRVIRVAAQELPFHEELRALIKTTVIERVYPPAREMITRFQASGQVRAGDPASIVRIIVTTLMSYVAVRLIAAPERQWDDETEIELMVQVVAQGLAPPR